MAGLRLRTGTRIRRGGRLACSGLVAVPLVTDPCHVTALLLGNQGGVCAYRDRLRHRIQGVKERAALVVVHGTGGCVTVAYYVVVLVVEDMRTGRHLLRSEISTGLGTRIGREDEEGLVILSAVPFIPIVPDTSFLLGRNNGVAPVAE